MGFSTIISECVNEDDMALLWLVSNVDDRVDRTVSPYSAMAETGM